MTKQVQLRDGTYVRLRGRRRPGESFSDAIDRLLGPKPNLLGLGDIGTAEEKEEAARIRAEIDAYSEAKERADLKARGLL